VVEEQEQDLGDTPCLWKAEVKVSSLLPKRNRIETNGCAQHKMQSLRCARKLREKASLMLLLHSGCQMLQQITAKDVTLLLHSRFDATTVDHVALRSVTRAAPTSANYHTLTLKERCACAIHVLRRQHRGLLIPARRIANTVCFRLQPSQEGDTIVGYVGLASVMPVPNTESSWSK